MSALAATAAGAATIAVLLALPAPVRLRSAHLRPPVPGGTGGRSTTAAGRDAGPGRLLATAGVPLGLIAVVGLPAGALLAPVAAALTWWLTGRMESPATRRRRDRIRADLPHVVDLLAATLAAGLAPDVALQRVCAALDGPVVEELATVTRRLALGVGPLTAWSELGRHPQLGPLGRCVARSVDGGSSVADAMSRLAEDLRQDLRAQVETRARAVGVKAAVPLGVCMLPGFLLVGVAPLVAGLLPVVLGR